MATVLVVDDHPTNRELIVTLLGYRGHRALEASDGVEALGIVRTERPSLVISDILMPTMDGFEFVHRLRGDPRLADTNVIFFTAHYHEREARNLARTCGVQRVLAKPCDPEVLLEAIDQALANTPQEPVLLEQHFDRDHLRVMTDMLSDKVGELQAANQRLAALNDLNLQLASERDRRTLLERVCRGARELVGAQHVVICASDRGDTADFFAVSGFDPESLPAIAPPRLDAVTFRPVMQDRRTLRSRHSGDASDLGLPRGYPAVHSWLAVPVASLDAVYGWICATNKVGADEFSAEDARILTTLGSQVGRIYQNGILFAQLQQSTEALLEGEMRFRRAQHIAKLAHIITRSDGSFDSWSETLPRLTGLDPKQMPTNTREWLVLVHPDDREAFRRTAITAGASGKRAEIEYRLRRVDGSWIHIHQMVEPVEVAGGIARWFSTMQDVTEQRLVEAEVRRLNTDLERRVAERTAELEAANKELEAFDYSISHDLRGPLGRIQGFSTAILEDFGKNLEPECLEYLKSIDRSAQRMDQLVGDLLRLATVTRGDIHRIDVNVSDIVLRVGEALHHAQPGRNVTFDVQRDLMARADPGLLRIVLENLLGNAWKFTSKRADARIEFGREENGSFYIRDNGAGFDNALAAKLFEPFRRLHERSDFDGTGIGLATVNRIIRRHGGTLSAEGVVGQGATFRFTLAGTQ